MVGNKCESVVNSEEIIFIMREKRGEDQCNFSLQSFVDGSWKIKWREKALFILTVYMI